MFFYFILEELNEKDPYNVNEQHACVVFAEGLKKINIPYGGNRNFQNPVLIPEVDVTTIPKDAIIVTREPFNYTELLNHLHKKGHIFTSS